MYSTLQGWEEAQNATTTALESNGSAIQENEKYLDSIQGKVEQFNVALQTMWTSALSTDAVKTFIELGTSVIKLVDNMGLLKTGISIVTAILILNSKAMKGLTASSISAKNITSAVTGTFGELGTMLKALASSETMAIVTTEALKGALTFGASFLATMFLGAVIDGISEYSHRVEDLIEKSSELATAYGEEQSSLDDQIAKYKQLNEQLKDHTLSTSEVQSIKTQLVDIQNALIETYGEEVVGINLVNGAYEKQLGLLDSITESKATEFINKNVASYKEASQLLNKIKSYDLNPNLEGGYNTGTSTEDEINQYKELLKLLNSYEGISAKKLVSNNPTNMDTHNDITVGLKANIGNADEVLSDLATKLREFQKNNSIDISGILNSVSSQYSSIWSEELTQAKTLSDEYTKAKVIENDDMRRAYNDSIEAIANYNQALASGDSTKIAETDKRLSEVKTTVAGLTPQIEGSQIVFDDLFSNISTGAVGVSTDVADIANDTQLSITKAFKALSENGATIDEIKTNFKEFGIISTDSLYDIIDAYPLLEETVNDFMSKKIDEKTLILSLDEAYKTDEQNYRNAVIQKNITDVDFYNGLMEDNVDLVKQLNDSYGIDLANYKNLQEAKLALNKLYQSRLLTAKRLELEAEKASALNTQESYEDSLLLTGKYFQADKAVSDVQAVIDGLDTSLDISLDTKTFQPKVKKAKAELQDYYAVIDWTAETITNLENELDSLNAKLDNTTSLKGQTKAYNDLIAKQNEYIGALKKTKEAQKTDYQRELSKLSKADQKKIENGSYTIQQFKGKGNNSAEEKHNQNITNVLKLKENLTTTDKKLYDAEYKVTEIAKDFADIRWDDAEKKVAIITSTLDDLNAQLENADSYEERNRLLGKILDEEAKIIDEHQKALTGNQSDVTSLYGQIDKKYRVNNDGKAVDSTKQIKTKGVTDPEQLALIKLYNADLIELRENTALLAVETENLATKSEATAEQLYNNSQAIIDNQLQANKNAQQDILNNISEAESLGGQSTAEQYNDLIDLSKADEDFYEQKKLLAENALKGTGLSVEETAKYKQEVQDCEDAISGCEVAQNGWNKSVIELPIKTLENANDKLKDTLEILNDQKDSFDKVIGAVTDSLDDEIKTLNEEKELINNEDIAGTYANRIKLIQDEVDALQAVNEQHKKEMELQQAQYNAERARNQKTQLVYHEGKGMVYEADTEAIRETQNALDELAFQSVIDGKESEIKSLDKEKETALKAFDVQIEKLNQVKEQWTGIADAFEKLAGIKLADNMLGTGWQDKILSGDTSSLDYVKSQYSGVEGKISNIEAEIKANDMKIKAIHELANAWEEAQLVIAQKKKEIEDTVVDNADELDAVETMKKSSTDYATEWTTTEETIGTAQTDINTAHTIARDAELGIINERIANLKIFATEVKGIAGTIASALSGILSDLATARSAKAEIANTAIAKTPTIKKAGEKHSGMETGYVGDNVSSRDAFRYVALDELKPNELVKVLENDEAVLTNTQQGNIMGNLNNAFQAGTQASVSKIIGNKVATSQPSFSVGEVHLHEVNDVNSLANAIINEFLPTMNQKLHK